MVLLVVSVPPKSKSETEEIMFFSPSEPEKEEISLEVLAFSRA